MRTLVLIILVIGLALAIYSIMKNRGSGPRF